MRRIMSLAASVALLTSIMVAGTATAAPPAYATTVTVYCDGDLDHVVGNLYTNFGAPNQKLLNLNGDKSFVAWGLSCPGDGTTPVISNTWTTKFAPTDAVALWDNQTTCSTSAAFTIPMDAFNTQCTLNFNVRVVIPVATKL
jgi:hypothetical protein